jgi:hypothetical protein
VLEAQALEEVSHGPTLHSLGPRAEEEQGEEGRALPPRPGEERSAQGTLPQGLAAPLLDPRAGSRDVEVVCAVI